MFKVGQKVVYVGGDNTHYLFTEPKINEIVTIRSKCSVYEGYYDLVEYPYGKNGKLQSCKGDRLRLIDYSFGEKLAEEINQEKLVK